MAQYNPEISVKYRQNLTGNTIVSLDAIPDAERKDMDFAFTLEGGTLFVHKYDAASALPAAPPNVVIPADTPATGRWIQQNIGGSMNLPPAGISITGGIYGLGYSVDDSTNINVGKGSCYDSTGTMRLALASDVSFPLTVPSPDTNYFLFMTNAGDIQVDVDITGATLLAGGVTHLRLIGFVRTTNAGDIYKCILDPHSDCLGFEEKVQLATLYGGAGVSTTGAFDISPIVPMSVCKKIGVGGNVTTAGRDMSISTEAWLPLVSLQYTNHAYTSPGYVPIPTGKIWVRNAGHVGSSAGHANAYMAGIILAR